MADGVVSGGAGASRLWWLKSLTLLLAAIVVTHAATFGATGLPGDSGQVVSEVFEAADAEDRTAPAGYVRVKAVTPGGQLDSAGVRAGDAIRFQHPWDIHRLRLPAEETFHLTVLREGRTMSGSFTTETSRPRSWRPASLMSVVTSLLMAAAGLTIALRSGARVGVLLGASLIAMAHIGSYTHGWENDVVRYFPVSLPLGAILVLAPVGIFAFALLHRAGAVGQPVSRLWKVLFWLYVAIVTANFMSDAYALLAIANPPLPRPMMVSALLFWSAPFVAFGLLIRAAFETTGQERTRFGFLAA
ncbi:MAG TPA: hypothetical protein VFF48_06130, partial [Brevundimonas sp.]|nr:hypothetical protein [Brevundimonas sp.]